MRRFPRDDALDEIIENDAVDIVAFSLFRHQRRHSERIGEIVRIKRLFHRVARAEQGGRPPSVGPEARRRGVDDVEEGDIKGLLQGRGHLVHRVRGEQDQSGAGLFQTLAGLDQLASGVVPCA